MGVVLFHSLTNFYTLINFDGTYYRSIVYLLSIFIMPCFFAISGYLYKPISSLHDYVLLIYKKVISLIVPYILFSIIYVFLQNISGGNNVKHLHGYDDLLNIFYSSIGYLWFLYALFIIFLIVGVLSLLKFNRYFQLLLFFSINVITSLYPNYFFPGLQVSLQYILYFYIGYILKNIDQNTEFSFLRISMLNLIALFIISIPISYVTSSIIAKSLGIVLLMNIYSKIPLNSKVSMFFDYYGKNTLVIYLVHVPIIAILRYFIYKFIPINSYTLFVSPIVLFALAGLISITISNITNRVPLIYFIFYPMKYINSIVWRTKFGKWLLQK